MMQMKTLGVCASSFTQPQLGGKIRNLDKCSARAYDIVLNGVELGGGSIRIHTPEMQRKIFNFLGLDEGAMRGHFGFLLEAQELGFSSAWRYCIGS